MLKFSQILNQAKDALGPVPDAPAQIDPVVNSIIHSLKSGRGLADAFRRVGGSTQIEVYAAAYRCVSLIAASLGMLPGYLEDDEGYVVTDIETIKDSGTRAAARVLFGKEPISGIFHLQEFITQVGTDLAVTGNLYSSIIRDYRGEITGLEYHPPFGATSQINRINGNEFFVSYELPELSPGARIQSRKKLAVARDVIHARLPGLSGITTKGGKMGSSPLKACERNIGIAGLAHDFQKDYFISGGFGNQAIISMPGKIEDIEAGKIADRLHRRGEYASGNHDRQAFQVIGSPVGGGQQPVVTPLTTDTQSTEMIKQSDGATEEVARAFGIPGPLLGIKETTRTQSGLESLIKSFLKFSLAPYQNSFERAITYSMFMPHGGYRFRLDTSLFSASSIEDISSFIISTYGNAQTDQILNHNEIRYSMLGNIPRRRGEPLKQAQANKPNEV